MAQKETNPQFDFDAVIFDLDGVVTKTALVHASSWKKMFDEYLKKREEKNNEPFKEFVYEDDYLPYVDGKPRYKGVQSFLESRGIQIPFGDPSDGTDEETVCGLGNRKNVKFQEILETAGVEVYPLAIEFVKDLKAKGIHVGVASSSKNCQFVLESAGIDDLFETRVDGVVSAELNLKGKPEGDIFMKAAANVGASPDRSVVVEDAVSGVEAGVNGGFALVIGVARENNEKDLLAHGADFVVTDFKGLTTEVVDSRLKQKKS